MGKFTDCEGCESQWCSVHKECVKPVKDEVGLMTLHQRIKMAEGANRALDGDIAEQLGLVPPWVSHRQNPRWATWRGGRDYWDAPAYTASIDAALTLVPEGWGFKVTRHPELVWPHHADVWTHENADAGDGWFSGRSKAAPALALCAAAIAALMDT